MAEKIQQLKTVDSQGETTRTVKTVTDPVRNEAPATTNSTDVAARVIWFIAGIIIVLLGIRFVFVLLGANPSNGFVDFIYNLSHPFAAPFFGIFGYNLRYGVSRFEASTIVAMAIYALITWGLVRLITIRRPAQSAK